MSTTVKVILIISAVLILAVICACLMTGGLVAIGTYLFTATPSPTVMLPTQFPTITPLPSDTPQPAFTVTPAATPTPKAISPDEGFTLDGVDLKVVDVRYSLINGGEAGAGFIDPEEGFLLVVAFSSSEMELGFLYDNYRPTTRLVDASRDMTYEVNRVNWSMSDSPTNSGYYLVSFPVKEPPETAVFYFNDQTAIDLTPLLPEQHEVKDPWLNTGHTLEVSGMDLKLQSATLGSTYNDLDGAPLVKKRDENQLLVIRFTSSYADLTGASEWYPALIDRTDCENTIVYKYMTWTNASHTGRGRLEYTFEVPPKWDDFVLYLPTENLMDIHAVVKNR